MTMQESTTVAPRERNRRLRANAQAAVEVHAPAEPAGFDYDQAVAVGKSLVNDVLQNQWRLGELAHRVTEAPSYGEDKLGQFATDIDIRLCNLRRHCSMYRAWKDFPNILESPPTCSVMQALQTHPERFELVLNKSDMTTREARELSRKYRQRQQQPKTEAQKNAQRWFDDVILHAGWVNEDADAIGDANEQELRDAIEPDVLVTLQQAEKSCRKLIDYFDGLTADDNGAANGGP